MANYSTGIAVSFGGSQASEVTSIAWLFGGSMPIGRGSAYTNDFGNCTVEMLSGVSTALYGVRGVLQITGGGADLSVMAVCIGVGTSAEINGVTRYTAQFSFV